MLEAALAQGAAYCEAMLYSEQIELPPGATIFRGNFKGAYGIQPIDALPDLVRRFGATQPFGRTSGVQGAVRFAAHHGEVWALTYGEWPACDLMVTKGENVADLGQSPVRRLEKEQGWNSTQAAPASDEMPLARYVLLKNEAQPDEPGYVLRVEVDWLAASSSEQNGIQLSMSYVAGTV